MNRILIALTIISCWTVVLLPHVNGSELSTVTEDSDFSILNVEDPYGKGGGKSGGGKGGGMKPTKPKTPKMPKTPKTPKTPKVPKAPKMPKAPKTPKTPKMPHTPKPPATNTTKPIKPIKPTPSQPMPAVQRPIPISDQDDFPLVDRPRLIPVRAGTCSGSCQDISNPCSTSYVTGLCPGPANIKCCPASTGGGGGSSSDVANMNAVQTQSNTKLSVGTYTGIPKGFSQTRGGALVFQGKMDTDCDGAPSCPSIDPYGQTSTSFTYGGKAIDALKVNYIVLPSDLSKKLGSKIKLGDIAAVMYNGKVSYAVYADNGPLGKGGEGSVHLSQELGFNPYCGTKICRGISSGVSYVVFPGSRSKYSSPYDSATIAAAGKQLLMPKLIKLATFDTSPSV